jgi:hypothetical protein
VTLDAYGFDGPGVVKQIQESGFPALAHVERQHCYSRKPINRFASANGLHNRLSQYRERRCPRQIASIGVCIGENPVHKGYALTDSKDGRLKLLDEFHPKGGFTL